MVDNQEVEKNILILVVDHLTGSALLMFAAIILHYFPFNKLDDIQLLEALVDNPRWNSQSKVQGLDPFGIHSGENLPT